MNLAGAAPASPGRPAHRDPNALRWVAGYLSSLVGDQVWFLALAWAAVQAGSPAQAGLVLAAGSVPRAALLLLGGALADRWGPRRAALATDATRTVLMLSAAGTVLLLPPSIALLVALAAAFGVLDALFLPATGALPRQVVAAEETVRLQAMKSGAERIATTAGAPLGGVVVAAAGAGPAFAAAAGATALSVLALVFTRVRPAEPVERKPLLREVQDGLRYVARHPVLRPLLILAAVFEFGFTGAFNVGLPILAQARGWGAQGVGVLLGTWGAAATLTALALVTARRLPRVGVTLVAVTGTMAAGLAGMGLTPHLLPAAAMAAVVGAGAGLAGSLVGSLVLGESSEVMVARVSSLAMLASLGLAPVAFAATGVAASLIGPASPFLAGSAISLLAAGVALAPALREARFPHRVPDGTGVR